MLKHTNKNFYFPIATEDHIEFWDYFERKFGNGRKRARPIRLALFKYVYSDIIIREKEGKATEIDIEMKQRIKNLLQYEVGDH